MGVPSHFSLIKVFCLLQALGPFVNAALKPNIVFILADDLGWNDVSFHGMNQILTPNIDTLAGDSLILNNYYVQPLCSPTRGALMTSKYPMRLGLQHFPFVSGQPYGLSTNLTLLPQYLKKIGYTTHAVGKWHLGYAAKEYTPIYRGFDSHYGYWGGAVDYYQKTNFVKKKTSSFVNVPSYETNRTILYVGYDFRENMDPVESDNGEDMTELLTKRATEIIKQHNQAEPLFLYLAQIAVHAPPNVVPMRSPEKYKKRFQHIEDKLRKNFAGELTALDESVGRVMEALYDAGMLDNTIVVFSSDNGADLALFPNGGSNYPLRGSKASVFEGGIRAVGMVWSPLLKNTPRVSNDLMHITDWLPTLYHAAGGNVKDLEEVDGVDNWEMISEGKPGNRRNMLINIDQIDNISAYRDGDYKIVFGRNTRFNADNWFGPTGIEHLDGGVLYNNIVENVFRRRYRTYKTGMPNISPVNCGGTGTPPAITPDQCLHSPCLFNLAEDPCEYHDLSSKKPEKTRELLEAMNAYRAGMVQPFPEVVDYNSNPMKHCGLWTTWMNSDQDDVTCNN